MAAKKIDRKAGEAARLLRENPYLQRIIEDPRLRANLRSAYDSGRVALNRLNNGKAPAKALMQDKRLQKELRNTIVSLREASDALREPPKRRRRRRGGIGTLLMLAIVGSIAAVALNEGLRDKLLDALFGAEEEFDYTSTTTPSTPPPAPAQQPSEAAAASS